MKVFLQSLRHGGAHALAVPPPFTQGRLIYTSTVTHETTATHPSRRGDLRSPAQTPTANVMTVHQTFAAMRGSRRTGAARFAGSTPTCFASLTKSPLRMTQTLSAAQKTNTTHKLGRGWRPRQPVLNANRKHHGYAQNGRLKKPSPVGEGGSRRLTDEVSFSDTL